MSQKIIFFTFCSKKFAPTIRRINQELDIFSCFNFKYIYTEADFDDKYLYNYRRRFKDRGMGFWSWKSYFAKKTYDHIAEGDILVYCDAGCIINKTGRERFLQYVEIINHSNGLLAFNQDFLEKDYTKADLLYFVDKDYKMEYDRTQLFAGIWILKKNRSTQNFINEWYDICHNHYDLISDKPSIRQNSSSFVRNSADQSAFSLLMYKYKATVISGNEIYNEDHNWALLKDYPFIAARKKEYGFLYGIIVKVYRKTVLPLKLFYHRCLQK